MAGLLKFGIRLSARAPKSTTLLNTNVETTVKTVSVSNLHTGKQLNTGTWKIPERLAGIPEAENPNFFNMVEYYFHQACVLAEERLMKVCSFNYSATFYYGQFYRQSILVQKCTH